MAYFASAADARRGTVNPKGIVRCRSVRIRCRFSNLISNLIFYFFTGFVVLTSDSVISSPHEVLHEVLVHSNKNRKKKETNTTTSTHNFSRAFVCLRLCRGAGRSVVRSIARRRIAQRARETILPSTKANETKKRKEKEKKTKHALKMK